MPESPTQPETEALADYAASGSHAAFRRIVQTWLPLVMSTALRRTGGRRALAEDVTQEVFIALARQAKSVRAATLSGWLFRHTCFTASKMMRAEKRRVLRERAAAVDLVCLPKAGTDKIDDILLGMGESDRQAVLLRYVEGRSHDEVAQALGTTPAAARKRAERAMDRLREIFRGEMPAGGLASVMLVPLSDPSGLATSITATALAGAKAPIPWLAKPVAGALWGAAAAITLAAVPLALAWRDSSAARIPEAPVAAAAPAGVPWKTVASAAGSGLPKAPKFRTSDEAVQALLALADHYGVEQTSRRRATALVSAMPEGLVHSVLLGLEKKMPATITGSKWADEVFRALVLRWKPRRVPDDLIAVWSPLGEANRSLLFRGCATADLAATRRLLDGFETEEGLGDLGTRRREYHNALREAVLGQLVKDSPREAAAFFNTMPSLNAWNPGPIGYSLIRNAPKDPAIRKAFWMELPAMSGLPRHQMLGILLDTTPAEEAKAAVESVADPAVRAELATAVAARYGTGRGWWESQVPEALRPKLAVHLTPADSDGSWEAKVAHMIHQIEQAGGGADWDGLRVLAVKLSHVGWKIDPALLADTANRIAEPADRIACLMASFDRFKDQVTREEWMRANLRPEEVENIERIRILSNRDLPE